MKTESSTKIQALRFNTHGFKAELNHLKDYLIKNRWWLLLFNALLLIVWGAWIFNSNPRIDAEVFVSTPESTYNWLDIGRYGLVLTGHVFGIRWFNPFFSVAFGYLLICIAGTLFGYCLWRIGQKNPIVCSLFSLICFTAPVMVDQFYFSFQMFEIAWAFVLCAAGVALSFFGFFRKNLLSCIGAILCLVWSFASYQSFMPVYIAMVLACYLLFCRRRVFAEQKKDFPHGAFVFTLIGIFVIAFIINTLIAKIFFASSSYLDNKVVWGKGSLLRVCAHIFFHVTDLLSGNGPFYNALWSILAIAVFVCAICDTRRNRGSKGNVLYVLAAAVLQLCPFLLTIYMGHEPAPRAQMAYPVVIACDIIYLLSRCWNRRGIRNAFVLISAVLILTQTQTTMRLIYTDEIRTQEDARLAGQISQQISNLDSDPKPIAFVGTYKNTLNPACLRASYIGLSIFDCNSDVSPHYYYSSARACNLSQIWGISWQHVTQEQMLEARTFALDMPVWPSPGSVADAGDFIVVKLSEDQWEAELSEAPLQ